MRDSEDPSSYDPQALENQQTLRTAMTVASMSAEHISQVEARIQKLSDCEASMRELKIELKSAPVDQTAVKALERQQLGLSAQLPGLDKTIQKIEEEMALLKEQHATLSSRRDGVRRKIENVESQLQDLKTKGEKKEEALKLERERFETLAAAFTSFSSDVA